MTAIAERRIVGYCLRCGGDCEDDGIRNFHKCPKAWPSAPKLVQLKQATDRLALELGRRPWAASISAENLNELKAAVAEMQDELRQAVPVGKG